MVVLAIVLLLLGLLTAVKILFWIGLILLLVGIALNFGLVGGSVDGPRRRYY